MEGSTVFYYHLLRPDKVFIMFAGIPLGLINLLLSVIKLITIFFIDFYSIQFVYFAINQKLQHKYIIDDTQYSYYYNVHT